MRLLDLFSGIGGFSLGLERAGFQTVAFCEIEEYPRAVLAKHWPGVPIYNDVRTLSADTLRRDGVTDIDAICGGFPCQDLSYAGKRAGIEGARSGLWSEYARLVGEIRPHVVIVENVPGLLSAGLGRVLADLSALGYDAVWDCVPASAVSAPHRRDRVWIIAHAAGGVRQRGALRDEGHTAQLREAVAHSQSERRGEAGRDSQLPTQRASSGSEVLAYADNTGLEGRGRASLSERPGERVAGAGGSYVPDTAQAVSQRLGAVSNGQQSGPANSRGREPVGGLGRVADGFPDRLDGGQWLEEPENIPRVTKSQENRASRLKALGNAVVPQVVELIGRAVMAGVTR